MNKTIICLLLSPFFLAFSNPPMATIKNGETIAFLGDSITAGGANYGGYCRLVVQGLKSKGINVKAIFAGVPGNKSSDMLLRLDGILKQKPDHLFLSVGVNDVWHTDPTAQIGVFKPTPGLGVELEHFKIYVPQILDKCKAAGTKVIMSTFTQITENPEHRLNKKAKAYNEFLWSLAKKRNLPIALLNEAAWAKIAELVTSAKAYNPNRNVISSDGIHPTRVGHKVMALEILTTMGLTDADLTKVKDEWSSPSKIMIIGDRQVNSGSRPGGWRTMLLDCMNSVGREMVTDQAVASWKGSIQKLVASAVAEIDDRTRYILFVPPISELKANTSLKDFDDAVRWLAEMATKRNIKLVVCTYGLVGADLNSKINVNAEKHNVVLRKICKDTDIALADIAEISKAYLKANPGAQINFGDERFNYIGSIFMVEAVYRALGGDVKVPKSLRETWDNRGSYTYRYSDRLKVKIELSAQGEEALKEISDRYHKLDADKILAFGIHTLLYGDSGKNTKRLTVAETTWTSTEHVAKELTLRKDPGSACQKRVFEAYAKTQGIDLKTFYRRAFLVGMFALRKEDPLGRGTY